MGKAAYPTAADLTAFLLAADLTLPAAAIALYDEAVLAGQQEFERLANRVFLATAAAERSFDPPTNGQIVFLDDLSAAPTLVSYAPLGSTAETWVSGGTSPQFRMLPLNALVKGEPYTMMQVFGRVYHSPTPISLQGSLKVTGAYGYAATIPESVWMAILALSAQVLWAQIITQTRLGLLSWTEAGVTETYDPKRWETWVRAWNDQVERALMAYRRVLL